MPRYSAPEQARAQAARDRRERKRDGGPVRRKRKRISEFTLVVLLTLVLGLAGLFMLGFRAFVILTGSMGKTAPPGSLVIARMEDSGSIEAGDIILIPAKTKQDVPKMHRVIDLDRTHGATVVNTKGDANDAVDLPTTLGNRVAKMVVAVPSAGEVVLWFQDFRHGIFLGILICFLAAAIWTLAVYRRGSGGHRHRRVRRGPVAGPLAG